ncbi:hypothetical protein AMS68_002170 [Peltaster fructicola]|uniref:Alpha-taxilin n=1 Tax=Peltaster fructicola TaxID=286661 RepID=A0A6H0XPL6_9PEZI|nr:hypothetical protein AMS68_002170 [Peltaster fructicola]
MATVASQQSLPQHNSRNSPVPSTDYGRDSPASEAATPPLSAASAKNKNAARNKKNGGAPANAPADAHKALLSKISQLEASSTETAKEEGEIEAEVKKANRDLSQLLTTMEPHNSKLDVVQRKYSKKRGDQLQKEKEEVSKTLTKEKALKEKLEKLSRELTKENKKLKEDLRDEKESGSDRNEELHRKLEGLVVDVESVILDRRSPERQQAEMEQDKLFREKFTSFLHQYELRELHFQSVMRMKDLEIAYQMSRHDALKKAQESELSKSHQLTRQVSTFSQTENELRGQLNVYVEKFKQQVEDTLNNSNDLFLTFRKEMEEMSKKTKRLEKENLNLTRKQEATNKNIFQMAEERSQSQQIIDRLNRENEKLKTLCRAMQKGGYGADGPAGSQHDGAEDFDEALEGETESEYEDDEEEYDEDEAEYEDDTEEEVEVQPGPKTFGPPPPPPAQLTNGVDILERH